MLARLNYVAPSRTSLSTVLQKVLRLEYSTVLVACAETVGALVSGIMAGSVALEAFGVDSLIEVVSAIIVLGEIRVLAVGGVPDSRRRHRDHRGLSILFFALIVYVVTSVVVALARRQRPHENAVGVVVCCASLLAMGLLATLKRRSAMNLEGSEYRSLARLVRADAAETLICGILSLSTLLGIVLAASLRWWWADPVASLVIIVIAVREGREAWNCEAPY